MSGVQAVWVLGGGLTRFDARSVVTARIARCGFFASLDAAWLCAMLMVSGAGVRASWQCKSLPG